ncbi:MAG: hypothetical protein GY807_05010 [Gammaproteobacteria bacterium]|nr:hypothetical protein [Gammaproteobacteria bacterium]
MFNVSPSEGGDASWDNQLSGIDYFRVSAYVEGVDISMLVTSMEIEAEMRQRLQQAGIWVLENHEAEEGVPKLTLNFFADSIEPVLPSDEGEVVRIYPIFIDLELAEPVHGIQRSPNHSRRLLIGKTWWANVQAWAVETRMRSIACMAVEKALDEFIADYQAANAPVVTP